MNRGKNGKNNVHFNPIISSIQKVAMYETKTKLYLIGSNYKESRFRVLEVDRTSYDELKIYENPHELDALGIRQFLNKIRFTKSISAYGILGFVRFLEGYYIVLITKRTSCAMIGLHTIYTIKDTVMIRIMDSSANRPLHPNEARYERMFCNVDLKSNFYFCYSYDLTRPLQHNMSGPKFVGLDIDIEKEEPLPDWSQMNLGPDGHQPIEFAFRSVSRKRFVWNDFLLKPLQKIHYKDWILEVIHGFISQSNINIFGRSVYVCLIARRSTKFAGTRFLKRGANWSGDVANEVETEQIVSDGARLCSFVQMRGSIPSHWSQDTSKIVSKPPISLDLADTYAETAGKHFERLLYHHGAPIIVFNLVKKHEKRKHESILTQEIRMSIKYLNQFIPAPFKIKYIHFDMARKSRGSISIMTDLARIAESIIQQTGMYLYEDWNEHDRPHFQTGLVRVNCVDCLDRTNTAQFAIGKCALAHQLHILGFMNPPLLEFDSDCVTMLEALYEDHGDTLALQYGGSQLVHRIKTYRKTAAWTSQGNDIMQTMSRYYSNKFSDAEKQHSINLFLGYFVPYENQAFQNLAIWDLQSDYYMHNLYSMFNLRQMKQTLITDWVRPIVLRNLPHSTSDSCKIVSEFIRVPSKHVEMVDAYSIYHIPNRYTVFEEHIAFHITLLSRNFVRQVKTHYSPFKPGVGRINATSKNPSLTGQSSTTSTTDSTSSSGYDDDPSSDEDQLGVSLHISGVKEMAQKISFSTVLSTMAEIYGTEFTKPKGSSLQVYRTYAQIGRKAKTQELVARNGKTPADLVMTPNITDYKKWLTPTVSQEAADIYADYLQIPEKFKSNSLTSNYNVLNDYINITIK